MTKEEAKEKIEILSSALNWYVNYTGSTKLPEAIICIVKSKEIIKKDMEMQEQKYKAVKELKKLNLVDEFISTCNSFDIHEALEISKRKATYKLKNFDFSEKEKDIILKKYRGDVFCYLERKGLISL